MKARLGEVLRLKAEIMRDHSQMDRMQFYGSCTYTCTADSFQYI